MKKNSAIEIAVRGPEGFIGRRDFPIEEADAREFAAELAADGFEVRFERLLDSREHGTAVAMTAPFTDEAAQKTTKKKKPAA